MGRHKQPEIRARILDACVAHCLHHGLPDRLGPLARATGVSPRMLIYHFSTRDGLLRAVLAEARRRQIAVFTGLLAPRPGIAYQDTLRLAWTGIIGPEGLPYLTMFGQLREDAEQSLWPNFRHDATAAWLRPLADGLKTMRRPDLATLTLAVIRGLVMDLEATGDRGRVNDAFDNFLAMFVSPVESPKRRSANTA